MPRRASASSATYSASAAPAAASATRSWPARTEISAADSRHTRSGPRCLRSRSSSGCAPPSRSSPRSPRSESIEAVERRDLVGLGERWVVEDAVAEVLDGSAVREHGLADVDDLGRTVADRVDAEEL